MQEESARAETLEALSRTIREASALGQMFSEAVAAKLGLGGADVEYLDLVWLRGRLTAGELAAATGLTTGAVTGLVDRLERAGFVVRQGDPKDRRRVFVTVRPEAVGRVAAHYQSMAEAMARLAEGYSDGELAMFLDYFSKARDILRAELSKARAGGIDARSAPRGGAAGPRGRDRRLRRSSFA
jgi:DNA-binding MarR family transcriptional regulator